MIIQSIKRVASHFLKLAADAEGNTIIEFSIVLPIMLAFFFSIIGFGFVIFESAVLQGALSTAAREGKTGFPNTGDSGTQCTGGVAVSSDGSCPKGSNPGQRWQEVQTILQGETSALFDKSKLILSATSYPDFIALEADRGGTGADVGGSGQVVRYTATYPCPQFLLALIGLPNIGNITATNIIQNESF
jgi:hypothetical protein